LAASLVLGAGVAVVAAAPAQAATICDQYGTTTAGNYVIMNNRWGTSATQCIETNGNGFRITQQAGTGNTSGAPVSYPAIYLGCHYTNCSPGSPLPKQISTIGSAPSSITYTYVSGTYDAAYDIWLDPTAKKDGVNRTEIMIWFNRQGSIQPIGSQTATANVGGRSWAVWTGNNGSNDVVSYVAPSAITSWSFDVMDFIRDTISRGRATTSWYLTSIQAGFEPWIGGTGLAVSNFSASVTNGNGGGGGSTTTTSRTTTTSSTTSTTTRSTSTTSSSTTSSTSQGGGGGGTRSCTATISVQSWNGGFVASGKVTAGSAALTGWDVTLNLGGATITNGWNGTFSGSHVTNTSYPGTVGAGGSTEFGFQGTGSASGLSVAGCTAR
jgi:hypothetical protein